MSVPDRWKAAPAGQGVRVVWGDLSLALVPANGAFCFCPECCPEPEAVWAWLTSLPAPPAALLEALERQKARGE